MRRFALIVFLMMSFGMGDVGAATNEEGVAVIIGNRTYSEQIPEVSYAHRDAEAIRLYVTGILGYDPDNIIDLRDATQSQFLSVFGNAKTHEGKLWSYLDPNGGSDVTIFYSGHGVPGQKDGRGYLLPSDADPDTVEINGYPIDLLYKNLGKLKARSITVMLDACFSGNSAGGKLIRSASPVFLQASLPTVQKNITVLTAASGTQLASWDEEAQHGLFTTHLLDALYGKADADGDKQISAGEVKAYLDRKMTRAARRKFLRTQQAGLTGNADVILARAFAGRFAERPRLQAMAGTRLQAMVGTRVPKRKAVAGDPAGVKLPSGLTLADWASLAEARLKMGELTEVVVEAGEHARKYGAYDVVDAVMENALQGLLWDGGLSKDTANDFLSRIAKMKASAGERLPLLEIEAQAHHLLGAYAEAREAYGRWLRAADSTDSFRQQMVLLLYKAERGEAIESSQKQRTEKVIMALLSWELGRRNYELLKRTDAQGGNEKHRSYVTNFPSYGSFVADNVGVSDSIIRSIFRNEGGRLTVAPSGMRVAFKRSDMEKRIVVALPAGHETAANRIAIYAPAIKRIADAMIENRSPLDDAGRQRMAAVLLRLGQ